MCARRPEHVTLRLVGESGQDEQQVGQAIEVGRGQVVHATVIHVQRCPRRTLGPTYDRTSHVEMSRSRSWGLRLLVKITVPRTIGGMHLGDLCQELENLRETGTPEKINPLFEKIQKVARANIGEFLTLTYVGQVSEDSKISTSVKRRALFAREYPGSVPTQELEHVVRILAKKLERNVLVAPKESGLGGFFKRLMEQF